MKRIYGGAWDSIMFFVLSGSEKSRYTACRNAAGVIMKLAYGYSLTGDDDSFIQVAEESSKISGWALAPGRWLVDYYPIRKSSFSGLP